MRYYKSNLYVDTFVTIAFYCMYVCMNFVHTVAFYDCWYRYCYLQSVAIAFLLYLCVYELCTQLRLTTVFKE